MALCSWCGRPSEPSSAFCVACGGDTREASLVSAHSGRVRVLDLPDTGRGASSQLHYSAWAEVDDCTDPFWRREPDPSQFRLLQLGSAAVVGQFAPTAAERDRQFRYGQAASAGALPRLDRRYPAKPAIAALRPDPPTLNAGARLDADVSLRGRAAHGRRRVPPQPAAGPADGTRTGRWVALAAACLLGVAAFAVVLAGQHGTTDRVSLTRRQPANAAPSASVPQPTVDGLVTIEPDVATAPHEPAVAALLNRYFSAINGHAYRAYKRLFSPAARAELSAAMFRQDYAATTESAATLWSIGVISPGQVEAVVTFTSYQRARYSPTQASCATWRISLHLIRSGHGYLVEPPPRGDQPSPGGCS